MKRGGNPRFQDSSHSAARYRSDGSNSASAAHGAEHIHSVKAPAP